MATRRDQARAAAQIANSAARRKPRGVKPISASMKLKWEQMERKGGRALPAKTKSLGDAKAGKPGDGKKVARWKTGPNGGEDQTTNGVVHGRGADGLPPRSTASRKSTRGEVPGGGKESQLVRRVRRAVASPEARAVRGK